jgi:atypical dual specificity phosphatase
MFTPQYAQNMNFSWVEPDRIAACRGPRDDDDLQFLASAGVRALVRLAAESRVTPEQVRSADLDDCFEPVRDFQPPRQDQVDRVVSFIRACLEQDKPVAVSCGAGQGRTGTMLACYLVSEGRDAQAAIDLLIARRPVCEEVLYVPEQREAVEEFAHRQGRS